MEGWSVGGMGGRGGESTSNIQHSTLNVQGAGGEETEVHHEGTKSTKGRRKGTHP